MPNGTVPLRKGANGTDTAVTLLLIKSGPHTCLGAPSALQSPSPRPLGRSSSASLEMPSLAVSDEALTLTHHLHQRRHAPPRHLRTGSGDDPAMTPAADPRWRRQTFRPAWTHAEVTDYLGSLAWVEVCRSTNYQVAHGRRPQPQRCHGAVLRRQGADRAKVLLSPPWMASASSQAGKRVLYCRRASAPRYRVRWASSGNGLTTSTPAFEKIW